MSKIILYALVVCLIPSMAHAGYTVVQIPKIVPQYIVAQGATGTETRLNPGAERVKPVGGVRVLYSDVSGLYGDDPAKRVELWEDVNGTASEAEIAPYLFKIREKQVVGIWNAATAWQEQYISGVAIGLLTLGVAQGKPKSLAIMQWTGALWAEYYRRKDVVMSGGAADSDFSIFGAMPYSVPELRGELGL